MAMAAPPTAPMPSTKVQRIMTQPIVRVGAAAAATLHSRSPPGRQNLIFRFLQSKTRVQIWLYENTDMRVEGRIIVRFAAKRLNTALTALFQGFDEYMNLVLDEAEELSLKRKSRKPLGRILLKGDTITLMAPAKAPSTAAAAPAASVAAPPPATE